jgi:hypothetical protein
MSTIFVRHQVANYDVWKSGFDEHGRVRREYGITDSGLYRDVTDPNVVTMILTADDEDRAREFLDSDDLRETMAKLGVVSPPDIWVTSNA